MSRTVQPKTDSLYGSYPTLSENELRYVELATDPEIKLRDIKEEDIAKIMGINKRSLYGYRQNNDVREAIVREQILKSSDYMPDVLKILTDMFMASGRFKDIKPETQLKAVITWTNLFGFTEDAKERNLDRRKELKGSFEKELVELDREFNKRRENQVEVEE